MCPKYVPNEKGTCGKIHKCLKYMVRPAGIEPAAYSLGGCRSIRLSYERTLVLVGRKARPVKVFVSGALMRAILEATVSGRGHMVVGTFPNAHDWKVSEFHRRFCGSLLFLPKRRT